MWLILFTIKATQQMAQKDQVSTQCVLSYDRRLTVNKITMPTLIFTYIILALLVGMIIFAYPKALTRHHDTFEMIHRFCGWTAIALVWCLVSTRLVVFCAISIHHDVLF